MRFWLFGMLMVAGVVLPYLQLVPWVREHGLDLVGFFSELTSNQVGIFFAWDLGVSAIALAVAAVLERARLGRAGLALTLVSTFCIGVSLGLPLFFWFWYRARLHHLEAVSHV